MPLIECVPNFSEGREAAVVDAIVNAMLAVSGVYLLAREMDADHHRSVISLAGEPQAVAEAAVRGVGQAAARIDLRRHRGAHPRVGACDVVPFIPLQGVTLAECVSLAEWAGAEIWRRYQVPVYLYEAAARRPERRNLEVIRRGQFEGLSELVRTEADRRPDFGEAELHPSAGATIVGARKFLIAYNVNLASDNPETARAIARTIRTSSGGMPAVKAMGVLLSDPARAQVSMNLTDFETTSVASVFRAVEREATKLGTRVVESELIGLIPRQAIEGAAAELLQLAVFDSERVIENRLATVMAAGPESLEGMLRPFLEALSSDAPAPGGGSAAAAAGAMAASLGHMVASLALVKARKQGAEPPPIWNEAKAEFADLAHQLARATDLDSEAFLGIRSAWRLPKSTPEEMVARAAAVERATVGAAEVPLAVAVRCRQVQVRMRALQPMAPPAMASDVSTALALAQAGFEGARDNVAINLDSLPAGSPDRRRLEAELKKIENGTDFPNSAS